MPPRDGSTEEDLSVFNQCSPRGYICVVLCFPCDDSRRADATHHIKQSLARLAEDRPLFAGRLYTTSEGRVVLRQSKFYDIPFRVIPNEDGQELDYEELKRREFPPDTFISPRYGIPGLTVPNCRLFPGLTEYDCRLFPDLADHDCGLFPVSMVDITFARGGLLLSIFLQHAITDGGSLEIFLKSFGNQTRNTLESLPSDQKLRIPRPILSSRKLSETSTFRRLVKKCPEYEILLDFSGPTQPRMLPGGQPISSLNKIGKIFVFTTDSLRKLRETIRAKNRSNERPTAYTSLAALAVAHITRARISTEPRLSGIEPGHHAALWNSVNWRKRAFDGATSNYFGNAVLPAVTKIPREHVNAACDDDGHLAHLVPLIKESINEVDEDYVRERMSMMAAAPDPRMVGVNYDPRSPEVLAFNTWRHFGADAQWDIPGVPVTKPDAIRRATGAFGLGTALILPARGDSNKQELFVSLSVDAMEALCQDQRWMKWVDRIIG